MPLLYNVGHSIPIVCLPSLTRAFQVTLKKDSPPDALAKAKEDAQKTGGTIRHEYTLIKGFTVEYPDDSVGTLQANDHIHVEQDGEVRIQ